MIDLVASLLMRLEAKRAELALEALEISSDVGPFNRGKQYGYNQGLKDAGEMLKDILREEARGTNE